MATPAPLILVVDDSETMRELLRRSLDPDWAVEMAETADEALTLARKLKPDVILLDFVLPDADGLVLLREMRRWGVDAQVVALTSATSTEVAYRFLRAGVTDFLSKPRLTSGDLRAAVRHALRLRAAGAQLAPPQPVGADEAHALLDDPPEETDAPGGPLRVLVVDDTAAARMAVARVLERQGWRVDEAESVSAALARVAEAAPDAVLLDFLLPDMDGVEAMATLRAAGCTSPILGLSGHTGEDVATRFLRAGGADFLGKDDLSEERFVHAIRRAVALRAQR